MVACAGIVKSYSWKHQWTIKLRYARLDPIQFTILTHLGHFADSEDGSNCYPSLSRLALDANISLATVKRHLSALERAGWITRDRGCCDRNTRYELHLNRVDAAREALESATPARAYPRLTESLPSAHNEPLPNTVPSPLPNTSYSATPPAPRAPHQTPPQNREGEKISPPAAHVPIHHERASADVSARGGERVGAQVQDDLAAGELVFFSLLGQDETDSAPSQTHDGREHEEAGEMATRELSAEQQGQALEGAEIDGRPAHEWIAGLWRRGMTHHKRRLPSPERLAAIGLAHLRIAPQAPVGAHEAYVREWIEDVCAGGMSDGAILSRILPALEMALPLAVRLWQDDQELAAQAAEEAAREAAEEAARAERWRIASAAAWAAQEARDEERRREEAARMADAARAAEVKRADDAAYAAWRRKHFPNRLELEEDARAVAASAAEGGDVAGADAVDTVSCGGAL